MLLLHPGKGRRNPQNGRNHPGHRYTSGGAVLVEQKIDQLVADGKITPQQGEMLKEAVRRSYEALQAKLAELSVKDVTVEVSE